MSGQPQAKTTASLRGRGKEPLWLIPFALLVFTALAVPLLITEEEGLPRVRALREELHELHDDHARLREEILLLEQHVEDLKSDPETIERLARDELGMIRQDEVVFQF